MTQDEIQEKVNQIEVIYSDFQKRLFQLKSQQDVIISDFLKNLETAKMEELRKTIANG